MNNTYSATRVALGIALSTALVVAAHEVWTLSFTPLAWALMGVSAGFSLSGSV
ncbi:hypothetical protein AB0F88_15650 [Streptosporangium sp. NPDC023963]|uniref:hypothetical protein n=1 Tax=Streptosporangium sp. NPDC023963 TaxID=3155608 RepID=UPI0034277FAD